MAERKKPLVEQLTDAIYEASEWAIPPQMVDSCSIAALRVVRDHFAQQAQEAQFIQDRESLLCAVEELDEQIQ